MQKKLIALAVAGLASSATFAQSNVTIYGVADVGFVHSSASGTKTSSIDQGGWSSSRLGFKGEEALGDGLKALFTLEYGIVPDVNQGIGFGATGAASARQTWVGLWTSNGTVLLGRQNTLGKNASDKYDAMGMTTFSPLYALTRVNPTAGADSLHTSGRLSNAATYVSPKLMDSLVLSAQYAFAGLSGNDATAYASPVDQESTLALGADYTAGPLGLAVVHHRTRDKGTAALAGVNGNDATENFVAASYDFGVAVLKGTWQNVKRTTLGVPAPRDKIYSIGVQVPVTAAGKLYIGYAGADDGAAASADSDSWGIQYSHDLSKRTLLYAGYQRTSNDNGATSSVLANSSGRATPVAGASATGYGFGVKHSF